MSNKRRYLPPQLTIKCIEVLGLIAVSIGGGAEGFTSLASDGGNFETLNNLNGDEITW